MTILGTAGILDSGGILAPGGILVPTGETDPLAGIPFGLRLESTRGLFQTVGGTAAAVDGNPVGQWLDPEASLSASQATGGNRATYRNDEDGPCVEFNGTSSILELPNLANDQGWTSATLFALVKVDNVPPSSGMDGPVIGQFGTHEYKDYYPFAAGGIYSSFASNDRKAAGNSADGSLDDWHILEINSAANLWTLRINNSVVYTTATNTVAFGATPWLGRSIEGASYSYFAGRMKAVYLRQATPTTDERAAIVSYLTSLIP